jgi:predicted nucleic acid-binding protein
LNCYAGKEQLVKEFIADSTMFNISTEVISKCVNIRRHKKIKTPDAVIAATALAHEMTLITNNEKDFNNIEGLKIINPFKI